MSNAIKYLGELLSRQGSNLGDSYLIDQPEAAPLAAILEVKVRILVELDPFLVLLLKHSVFHI